MYSSKSQQLGIFNPRCANAARVTVVGLCVCVHCKSAVSHIEITKERYQRIHHNTGTILNVAEYSKKMLCSKVMT